MRPLSKPRTPAIKIRTGNTRDIFSATKLATKNDPYPYENLETPMARELQIFKTFYEKHKIGDVVQ